MIYKIYLSLKNLHFFKKYKVFYRLYNLSYAVLILFFRKIRVINYYDFKIVININDFSVGRRIFMYGFYDKTVKNYILNNIKKDQVVVDAGANIGLYSILMSKLVGHNGQILAFEADNRNSALLKKTIKLNNILNIKLFTCLLSNSNEKKVFYLDKFSAANNSIIKSILPSNQFEVVKNLESKTLDQVIINNVKRLDFIKCNIDGSEFFFIEGAKKVIKKFKPKILIEYNISRLKLFEKFNNNDYLGFFRNLDYRISILGSKKINFENSELESLSTFNNELYKNGNLFLLLEQNLPIRVNI